ncbi:MAG TPA: hypothetical protein VHB93_02295 [Candidatus Paceibacterota bacterium]|nr:hypothetical protein [Candidatus Paceibacterota bacterium]
MTDGNPASESSGDLKSELLKQIPRLRGFALVLCCNDRDQANALARYVLERAVALKDGLAKLDPKYVEDWTLRATLCEWRRWRKRGHRPHAHDAFAAAVGSLPDFQLETLAVVRGLGLEYASAAPLLRVAVGTVKSRIHRANRTLMEMRGDALTA